MLIPLHSNIWGITIHEQREHGLIIEPYKKKELHKLKVVAVGPECKYVKEGDIVILDDNPMGSVVTIIGEDGEVEHRYCMKEEHCLATWRDEL